MQIGVEIVTEEAQVGTYCVCGNCHPTATAYRDDPDYKRHSSRLATGPCCCGRFFAIGPTEEVAQLRANSLAARFKPKKIEFHGYEFHQQRITLPWGDEVVAVIADFKSPAVGDSEPA